MFLVVQVISWKMMTNNMNRRVYEALMKYLNVYLFLLAFKRFRLESEKRTKDKIDGDNNDDQAKNKHVRMKQAMPN